jgi:uncharacterized protein YwbE
MTYRGRVKNGVIVVDPSVRLREGEEVEVVTLSDQEAGKTWADVFKNVIGQAKGLPPDSSQNHDHYLYGTGKR